MKFIKVIRVHHDNYTIINMKHVYKMEDVFGYDKKVYVLYFNNEEELPVYAREIDSYLNKIIRKEKIKKLLKENE